MTELAQRPKVVTHRPALDDLAILGEAEDLDRLRPDRLAGGPPTHETPGVGGDCRVADHDLLLLGDHVLHCDAQIGEDRKSTRLNSSHANISYAVFCLKKKKKRV